MKFKWQLPVSFALLCSLCACSAAKPGTYTVSMEGNGTTGYSWSYTMSEEGIVKETATDIQSKGKAGMVGAPSTYTWQFTAVKAGTVTLTYEYSRSWEANSSVKTVVYTMHVSKDLQISAESIETDHDPAAVSTAATAETASDTGVLQAIDGNQVILNGNPTTGYDWTAYYVTMDDADIVKISAYEYAAGTDSGGTYTYTITGLKEGKAEIGFTYSRGAADNIANEVKVEADVAADLSVTLTEEPAYLLTANQITLAGNATTGYQWRGYYAQADSSQYLTISDYVYTPDDTQLLGSPGTFAFTLTGLKAGQAEIGFSYSRGSADTVLYDLTFACTVGTDLSVTCQRDIAGKQQ